MCAVWLAGMGLRCRNNILATKYGILGFESYNIKVVYEWVYISRTSYPDGDVATVKTAKFRGLGSRTTIMCLSCLFVSLLVSKISMIEFQ